MLMSPSLPPGTRVMFVKPYDTTVSFNYHVSFEYGAQAVFVRYSDKSAIVLVEQGNRNFIQISVPVDKIVPLVEHIQLNITMDPKPVPKSLKKGFELDPGTVCKKGQGFVSNEDIWAAVKAFGDGMF